MKYFILFAFLISSPQVFAYKASKTKGYKPKSYDSESDYSRPTGSDAPAYRSSKRYEKSDNDRRDRSSRTYSPRTQRNYERYKTYSPTRKKRLQKSWKSFKQNSKWNNLSDDRKRAIRRKVLEKRSRRNR